MLRNTFIVWIVLLVIPCLSAAEAIEVQIKGIDDGVKTTKQQDYKEAILFAKREAIERAGAKVKTLTTAKDFVVQSDYIESKAEAVLMPGYTIVDVGYSENGLYNVVLIGKIKTINVVGKKFELDKFGPIEFNWGMSKSQVYGLVKNMMGSHPDKFNSERTELLRQRDRIIVNKTWFDGFYKGSTNKKYDFSFINDALQSIEITEDPGVPESLQYYLGTKYEMMVREYEEWKQYFLLKYGEPAYNDKSRYRTGWRTPNKTIAIQFYGLPDETVPSRIIIQYGNKD